MNSGTLVKLRDIVEAVDGSVMPRSGQVYENYSVPSYDDGAPEVLDGGEIKSSKRPVDAGDVLVCKINPRINRVWKVQEKRGLDQIASTEWFALRCSDRVEPDFLVQALRAPSARRVIIESVSGATGSHTRARLVEVLELKIPLPPLAEQKRIVAKLDGLLGDVSLFEQALRIGASGTGDLRRSIIDSIMRGVDAPRLRLDEVCVMFADGDWIESKDQSASGIRLVQTGNVGDGQFKDRRDKARWIDQATFDRLKCTEISPGDILFSRLPDPVGRACLLPNTGDRMITAVDCTIARTKKDLMLPEFIVLYASSTDYYSQVGSMITGTTRDRISRKNLGAVTVPVPGLAQQRAIIAQVAELDADCATLQANIERRIAVAADLRQSVLEAAFRGEL